MKKVFLTSFWILVCMPVFLNAKNPRPEPREEKIVTNKFSLLVGTGTAANQFFSEYEYSGMFFGVKTEHGAYYKRSENLSWDLDLSFMSTMSINGVYESSFSNPANSNYWILRNVSVQYGTSYNWNPVKNLYLRAGGAVQLMLGTNLLKPDNINNAADYDIQPQLKASAGIKYGWDVGNSAIYIYGDVEIPVLGGALVNSKYQSSSSSLFNDVTKGENNMFILTSLHNMQGFDAEIGVDFSFRKWSLFVATQLNNRWWNAYEVQNYRKYNFLKLGVAVDLVSRPHAKCNGRYF